MNNNRGNNRRRGRGNNNRPQGGGQQLNRIDSRARGNAPQMLEKYRKLAQDAHLNGDRVQAEYYLQFADHYFRVIADSRTRVDEQQRQRQSGERWTEPDGEDEAMDFGMDNDFPGFDRQQSRREEPREPREAREPREQQQREFREPRENREPREPYRPRFEPAAAAPEAPEPALDMVRADEGEPITEAVDNPFVREGRSQRGLRPRQDRRPRREAEETPVGSLDPMSLPPPIGVRAAPAVEEAAVEAPVSETPAPKRRGRPRKNPLPEAAEG